MAHLLARRWMAAALLAAAVVKTYTNTLGTAFQPIQDTGAFSACP